MCRKIFAIIDLDEDIKSKNEEINGLDCVSNGCYLEKEFGWLEQSGISLKEWVSTDEPDESQWARYINYLIKWAFDHRYEELCNGMSPYSYDDWVWRG